MDVRTEDMLGRLGRHVRTTAHRSTVSHHAQPEASSWKPIPVPAAVDCCCWQLEHGRQLSTVRRDARRQVSRWDDGVTEEALERIIMVLDELATNALRHGSPPAVVRLCHHAEGWLVVVSDSAADRLPAPAIDRPAEQGGMGLYLVVDMTVRHGAARGDGRKSVWALVAT